MKVLRLSLLVLLAAGIFASCSTEEEVQPKDQTEYSDQAITIFEKFKEHNDKSDQTTELTIKHIQNALDGKYSETRMPCTQFEDCCFTQEDVDELMDNIPCSSNCPSHLDVNCDGVLNAADLLIMLAQFGCPDVEVIIGNQSGTNVITITDMFSSQLRNYTTIDGTPWYSSDPTITNARWYINGSAITNTISHFQFRYPGGVEYDYSIPCNGYYLVELCVEVQCQVYCTSECYYVQYSGLPDCTESPCG
ncbi:MAG: hypothetical protein GYB31_04135 [Bacteroidetes bacterium]|nr:hypothetical protein [Bacteroidota bacterium]